MDQILTIPSTGQRKQFLKEVSFYFDMTQVEQETKFSDTLPTVAEY